MRKLKFIMVALMLLVVAGMVITQSALAVPTVPDNGTGTADVPPINIPYENKLDKTIVPLDVDPASGLKFELKLELITPTSSAPIMADGLEVMGCESRAYDAQISLGITGYGALLGYEAELPGLIANVIVHTGPRNPGEPVQTIDTEIVSLELVGAPIAIGDFQSLSIIAGKGKNSTSTGNPPMLPSPGSTKIKKKGDGTFAVDSFFDITYEIEFEGTPAGPLGGTQSKTPPPPPEEKKVTKMISPQPVSPHFALISAEDWQEALEDGRIQPFNLGNWNDYMDQFNDPCNIDDPGFLYPPTEFMDPCLYVYPGDDDPFDPDGNPDDAGLVMRWGPEADPSEGERASAWKFVYPADPDLTNSTITVTVEPPCGMQQVSLGMQDINGNRRSWFWNVAPSGTPSPPPAGSLLCSPKPGIPVQTTITIDTSKTGVTAATPTAANYSNFTGPPAFDITQVMSISFDENNLWVASVTAPVPGSGTTASWNYWRNLIVAANPSGGGGGGGGGGSTDPTDPTHKFTSKWYSKWSQPPVSADPCAVPPLINGWDERSLYHNPPIVADDWLCKEARPVTDVHWWGSFIGWNQPVPPPIMPTMFHIGIWTDVAANDPFNNEPFSHPGTLVWENYCQSYVWNFAGYDLDPRIGDPCHQENEACFQFAQFLSEDEWFYQEDPNTVYWLSIAAIYNVTDPAPAFPWGWKTRPHFYNDDAVRFSQVTRQDGLMWPPAIGSTWVDGSGGEIELNAVSWDLSFELTTIHEAYVDNPIEGDIDLDRDVDLSDLVRFAENWLATSP
jgi:hypothetical protein